MKSLITVAAALALALSWTAAAQQRAEQRDAKPRSAAAGASVSQDDRLFDRLDANRDGYLSDAELERQPAERANWIAADRNGDGRISREEFTGIAADRSKK